MTDRHAGGITRNGLPVDLVKQQAWQRRGAEKYAEKQRLGRRLTRNQARLTTKIAPAKPRNGWAPAVRKLATKRSGGICELDGQNRATELHHRKLRRHRDHRIQNALHVCKFHHDLIHGNYAQSLIYGWLVRSTADPAKVSVILNEDIGRVLLDDRGGYEDAA